MTLAWLLPLLIILAAWAAVLYSKYDVFTTGSQFKANFIAYNVRSFRQKSPRFSFLQDTSPEAGTGDPSFLKMDAAMVNDPMPPESRAWHYRLAVGRILPLVLCAERANLPGALKELTILLTPGGVLGFALITLLVTQRRRQFGPEFRFTVVVVVAGVSLVLA